MAEKIDRKSILNPSMPQQILPVQTGVNLNANPNSIDFGRVNINSSQSKSFFLNNRSEKAVSFTISSPPSGFFVSPNSGEIPAGGSINISVNFSPSSPGRSSGYLNISPGIASVSLQGKAFDPTEDEKKKKR